MNRANYSEATADDDAALELTVPSELAGMRFDQALARLVPEHSRSRLKEWIDSGRVTLDGSPTQGKRRVIGGERIVVEADLASTATADAAEAIALAIVQEDDDIIVIDKPPGLVVHPGSGNRSGTLLNALLHHAPVVATLPRAGIVHRLDKDTSGLLVVAKNAVAQTDLVRQLQARTVKREYAAIVHGDIARDMTIDAPIGRHPRMRTTMAVVASGKPARTRVAPVERFGIATHVRCALETGRTHQIRVHLAAIEHPLIGDRTYGRRHGTIPAFSRQALHAMTLELAHPRTKRRCEWHASLPGDIRQLLTALRAMKRS